MSERPDISIIIVNYNTGELLSRCLGSIYRNIRSRYEVIVADNASSDGSIAKCMDYWKDRRFRLFRVGYNSGFAKANNIAATFAQGRLFHFLNPDTEVPDTLDEDYAHALSRPDAVYVNPLVNRDGSLENDRMPIPVMKDIMLWNLRSPKARYWYKGASVMISSENYCVTGGWPEDYFMYCEDLDFFYQLWLNDIPVRMLPSRIFHLGGGSSSRVWSSIERETAVQKSTRIFYRKYFSRTEYFLVKLYYLFHYLMRRPRYVPMYLKAWVLSGRKGES